MIDYTKYQDIAAFLDFYKKLGEMPQSYSNAVIYNECRQFLRKFSSLRGR